MTAVAKTVFPPGTDIWQGRTRPSVFIPVVVADPAQPWPERWTANPDVQVIPVKPRTAAAEDKNPWGGFQHRDDLVLGLRGCTDALLETYAQLNGAALSLNALAESLAAQDAAVTAGQVVQTLKRLNDGKTLRYETVEPIARNLGLTVLDLVKTLDNKIGDRLIQEVVAETHRALRDHRLPVAQVASGTPAVNALADAALGSRVVLDLDEAFFVPADAPDFDAANRALDTFRTVLALWKTQGNPTSVERGRISEAVATLARNGVHVYVGRVARLLPDGPDAPFALSRRYLVVRFSQEAGLREVPYSRASEIGLVIEDDEHWIALAQDDAAWAAQAAV